jgi:subtilisin family serine protease
VVNISLGGPAESTVLKAAVDNASAGGVVVVAAAGNKGTTKKQYPAAYSAVIAVSATNDKEKLATFSSHGNWVDLAAPGTNILSTRAGGGYDAMSGTSMSAPFVSALAGLLDSRDPFLSASQIRHRMEATASDLGPARKDPYFGYGRINANSAVE